MTPAAKHCFLSHPHFLPNSSSWLTRTKKYFAEITELQIWRRGFMSVLVLERAINDYLAAHNSDPNPFG